MLLSKLLILHPNRNTLKLKNQIIFWWDFKCGIEELGRGFDSHIDHRIPKNIPSFSALSNGQKSERKH